LFVFLLQQETKNSFRVLEGDDETSKTHTHTLLAHRFLVNFDLLKYITTISVLSCYSKDQQREQKKKEERKNVVVLTGEQHKDADIN